MLITFKTKAYPNVLMYQEHAMRILDLLQKESVSLDLGPAHLKLYKTLTIRTLGRT